MLLRAFVLFSVPAFISAACAYGHPGHAVEVGDSQSLSHYALHPDHLMTWIVGAVVLTAGWLITRAASRRLAPAYARVRKLR